MKYLFALLLGLLAGVAIFCFGLVFNPFVSKPGLSPLTVSNAQTMLLSFPHASSESIAYTNGGESNAKPFPEKILQLWEAPIRQTTARALLLQDGRGQPAGLGIKISSLSERTRPLEGTALVDSIWYVNLPGRGVLFIDQSENYWDYLRSVVFPAYRSSADTWKGTWLGTLTAGPGALGTARVIGGSGEFAGLQMLAVETMAVQTWRVEGGPIAADGQLLIEMSSAPVEAGDADSVSDVADDTENAGD